MTVGKKLPDTEEEADLKLINSINATNDKYMNNDDNFICKYYAQFLSSKNHEDVSSGSEYDSSKRRFHHNKKLFIK